MEEKKKERVLDIKSEPEMDSTRSPDRTGSGCGLSVGSVGMMGSLSSECGWELMVGAGGSGRLEGSK
jgi:hypothetical protein